MTQTTYVDEDDENHKLIVKHDSANNTTTVQMVEGNAVSGQGNNTTNTGNVAQGQVVTNDMKLDIDEKVANYINNTGLTGDISNDTEEIFKLLNITNKDTLKDDLIAKIREKITPASTGTSSSSGGKAKRSKKSAKKGKKSRGMKGKRGRRSAKKGRK